MMSSAASPPIPAATLVLMRARAERAPELLFVERSRKLRFAGGATVFPGGRIDPGDHALAQALAPGLADGAARVAAIRETLEETGVAVGFDPLPDAATIVAIRQALARGEPLGDVWDARLNLDALVPFARWLPNLPHSRVFDTLFYLATDEAATGDASVDATENTRMFWASAHDVIEEANRGELRIIFPTRRNLERLAGFADFGAAVADARAYPIRTVTPWTEDRDGVAHLCIPDDLGYPVCAEPVDAVQRG